MSVKTNNTFIQGGILKQKASSYCERIKYDKIYCKSSSYLTFCNFIFSRTPLKFLILVLPTLAVFPELQVLYNCWGNRCDSSYMVLLFSDAETHDLFSFLLSALVFQAPVFLSLIYSLSLLNIKIRPHFSTPVQQPKSTHHDYITLLYPHTLN